MKENLYSIFKKHLLLILLGAIISTSAFAQDVFYKETFTFGASYCPTSTQYDNWGKFRSQLDTTTKKFLKVTVRGTNDPTGITCSDPTLTRRIAEAMRARTNLNVVCDGKTWVVSSNRPCIGGCAQAADDVELIVSSAATCNCTNPSYIFRPCIGNRNWGGLNGLTCGAATQTMEVIFSNPVGDNAAPGGVTAPVTSCGSVNDSISVSIRNAGLNRIASVPVTCKVSGTLGGSPYNQTFTTTIGSSSDSLAPFSSRQHKFANINTSNGANLDILLYTSLNVDTTRGDDTLRYKYVNVGTPTGVATANNVTICGTGSATLTATVPAGHSAYWYNAANKLITVGATTSSPIIPGATQDSFFVASAKVSAPVLLGSSFNGSTSANSGFEGGNMFEVNPKKHITIESIDVHLRTTVANKVTVYMKTGSFNGFITNAGAWTLVGEYDVVGAGLGNATTVNIDPIELMPGNYSLYIYASDGLVWNTSGNNPSLNVEDFDLGLRGAVALEEPFLNQLGNQIQWDGKITYRQTCVDGTKAKVIVTANPLPVGSALSKGSLFRGTYDAGTIGQPDIIANPDTFCYEIPAPTNFNNSGYSSTWSVASVSLRTVNGTVIPTSDYKFTIPAGSDDATLCFYPSSTYTDSTVEVVSVVRRTDNGCDSTLRRIVYIAPRPVPTFTNTIVCFGEVTEFSNTSTILKGQLSYLWDFGDGTSSTLTDPAKTYNAAGNYSVTLHVTSEKGYTESITQTVTVKEIPSPNFRITNACEGTALQFSSNSILPPGPPTYVWDFGDANTGSGQLTTHLYAAPNIYPVKLTIDVAGCSNSITKYATQAPRSGPDFTFVNTQCDNLLIPFTNATTAPAFGTTGYTWKFGDGTQASQISPEHNYNVFNTFNVTLISTTDLGCVDSITKPVTLLESPKPVFSSTGQPCTNGIISFNNSTNIPVGSTNTYEWDFGDGNSSTDATPDNIYVSPGNYKVVLKAISTNGCDGETEVALTINEKPVSEFVANNVCEGEETKFSNGSTITNGTLTYTWDLDDGNPTTSVTNPSTTYVGAKTYNVSLVSASANGCNDTITKAVEVYEVPTATVAIASNLTQDGTMLFSTTTTGTGYTYFWTFGDGGNSSQQNPTYKYNFPGTWPVKLCVKTPNGCEDCLSTSVFVNPLSVNDLTNTQWTIYPNPSTGKFFIKYEGAEIAKVAISDILGKTITEQIPTNGSSELAIDLSNQKAGVYVITLTDENGNRSTQKVTITQ